MSTTHKSAVDTFDVIIIGGGHNGLVAAAYLARAELKVLVLEARNILGGPAGTFEFLPGYRSSFTNSPGSFEPRFVEELELERFGLHFVRTDPTVVQSFPGQCFVGWRDRMRIAQQLDSFAPGEADRYFGLLASLEDLARHMHVSIFSPSPDLAAIAKTLPKAQAGLLDRLRLGSLTELLEEELESDQARALLAMVALNATLAPPSAPGTAIGLMLRPISLASMPSRDASDPRNAALRGSTGLPIGGMGAIIDALAAYCRHHGAAIETAESVARVLYNGDQVTGVATASGKEFFAPRVISAINPQKLFADLLDDAAVGADMRQAIADVPMRGSAFKLVLALDGLPDYSDLPADTSAEQIARVQFRFAPSLAYIERAVVEGLSGKPSTEPIMWGLIPTVTSPDLAPAGHHLLSVNVWHAPYRLAQGDWENEREVFGQRCIDILARFMPNLRKRVVGHRFMGPRDLESELGLIESNITHGDMLPDALFGARPHARMNNYRAPLRGLYLSGAGTWPGGYVTGIPGYNASQTLIADMAVAKSQGEKEIRWNSL